MRTVGRDVRATYDRFGRLRTADNGHGLITSYGYDPMDRTTTATTSDYGDPTVTFTYDAVGNPIGRIDATGTTTYRYDKLNRPTGKDLAGTAADCSGGPTATRLCYGWDAASHMVSLGDGRGTTTYHYSPIRVEPDGVEVGRLRRGERLGIEGSGHEQSLRVRLDLMRSNVLSVVDPGPGKVWMSADA